jgi:hypothetical protein
MWPSVIKGVGLNLLCFSFKYSAAVMGPLIPVSTGIAKVASPPSTFVVVGAIVPDRLVGCQGGGFDVSVGHVDIVQQVQF